VLEGLIEEDDRVPEAWHLLALSYYSGHQYGEAAAVLAKGQALLTSLGVEPGDEMSEVGGSRLGVRAGGGGPVALRGRKMKAPSHCWSAHRKRPCHRHTPTDTDTVSVTAVVTCCCFIMQPCSNTASCGRVVQWCCVPPPPGLVGVRGLGIGD
jgi:hypothetical protein